MVSEEIEAEDEDGDGGRQSRSAAMIQTWFTSAPEGVHARDDDVGTTVPVALVWDR